MAVKSYQWQRILLGLIIVGAFLRFFRVGTLGTFLSDQAIELLDTLAISRGDIKLIGIKTSIAEVRNGAVMYYLLLPFLVIFKYHPLAGSVLQGLLSTATIPLAYLIGTKARDQTSGILSAAIVALSPLLVEYSRQTMLAYYPLFFASLAFLLLIKLLEKFTPIKAFSLGFIQGFLLQVSYLTFTLIPLSFLSIALLAKEKGRRKFYLTTVAGLIVGFSPMIVFELTHQFFNTQMLISYFNSAPTVSGRISALSYFPQVFSLLFNNAHVTLGWGIFLTFIAILLIRFKNRNYSLPEKAAIIHLIITAVVLLAFRGVLWYHYALTAFVPLIVLLASSFVWLTHRYSRLKWPVYLAAAGLVLTSIPSYRLFADHGAHMSPGWSLKGVERAAQIITSDVTTDKFNVAIIVDAQNQGYPLRYFLEVADKRPLGVAQYDQAETLYVIKEPGFDLQSAQKNIYELNAFGKLTQVNQWHLQNGYYLTKFEKN